MIVRQHFFCARYSQQVDEHDYLPQSFDADDGYEPSLEAWDPLNFVHQEVGSEYDALSDMNSEYMKLPLPEGIDDHVGSPDYEPSIGLEETFTPPVDTFGNDDANNLRRVIGDACAATPTVLSVTMPWDLPGINLVLGDEADLVPTPILEPMPISAREFVAEMPSHRAARVEHIRGVLSRGYWLPPNTWWNRDKWMQLAKGTREVVCSFCQREGRPGPKDTI